MSFDEKISYLKECIKEFRSDKDEGMQEFADTLEEIVNDIEASVDCLEFYSDPINDDHGLKARLSLELIRGEI